MANKIMNKTMKKISIIIVILLGNLAVFGQQQADVRPAQERADGWYGRKIEALQQQLNTEGKKYSTSSSNKGQYAIMLKDYRDVSVQYIAQDGIWISHRLDAYSRRQYKSRKLEIENEWSLYEGYYVLNSSIVAIFDDKTRQVMFIPVQALNHLSFNHNSSYAENFSMLIL